jgi:hypothetical protein
LLAARPAAARLKHRVPAFEPTDLDLEDPQTVELDLQVGAVLRDEPPKVRFYVPDFELDLGLTERVELDIDGALSLDETETGFVPTADTLWTCVKLGFLTSRDDDAPERAWALGAQLGPRLPTAPHSYGTGFGAVLLAARMDAPFHVIVNSGLVVEPLDHTETERSAGVLGGFDLDYDLDHRDRFSLLGELAGAYSLGPDPNDVHATLGIEYSASGWFDLSLVGFYGFVPGSDRAGLFLGLAPKWAFARTH